MAHWVYILSAVSGPVGLAAWRYAPRAFLMIVGGLTKDPQRSKQCAEMLRLQRKDAKDLPSCLVNEPANRRNTSLGRTSTARRKRRPRGGGQPRHNTLDRIAS